MGKLCISMVRFSKANCNKLPEGISSPIVSGQLVNITPMTMVLSGAHIPKFLLLARWTSPLRSISARAQTAKPLVISSKRLIMEYQKNKLMIRCDFHFPCVYIYIDIYINIYNYSFFQFARVEFTRSSFVPLSPSVLRLFFEALQ